MYIRILLNYILGYVNVELEGFFIEKLINKCISKRILLWDIKRTKRAIAYANIGIKDYKRVVHIAKETKCKIKIKNKKGLPFILNKYKKRKIFFIFLFLIILTTIGLSNFIWNIEVEGNEKITKEEIIEDIKNEGIKIGKFKHLINTKEAVSQIRLKRNDLAWIGIDVRGTNVIVKVVEADEKPDIIDENDFCNIVAKKPGVITKVNALNRYTRS